MAQKYDDIMKEQIGDLGDDTSVDTQETHGMGKLRHSESYTGKTEMSDDEKEDMKKFLQRSKEARNKNKRTRTFTDVPVKEDAQVSTGWVPIDKSEMGVRAQFYPETWEFMIRPATVQAIKNWTAIDETRLDVVHRVFTEIVKTCVRIDTGTEEGAGWAQINSWDRLWFILKVREYTFVYGESKIEFTDACSECGEDIQYTLNSSSLFYDFPDNELIEKYWTGSEWHIDPREYDVDHDPIVLYTPKLGKENAIIDWARAKKQQNPNSTIDEVFLKFLLWMLNKPSRDPAMLDRQITKLYNDYKSWDLEFFDYMGQVIDNLTINTSEQLKCKCPSCGREATSTVQFPNGVKVLFEVKAKHKKFGSR